MDAMQTRATASFAPGHAVVWDADALLPPGGWLALPEHDATDCPRGCGPAVPLDAFRVCPSCLSRWRPPCVVGGD